MSLNDLKIVKYKIITAVLTQHVSPFPRNYRDLRPHPHSVTVRSVPITAEYPPVTAIPIHVQLTTMHTIKERSDARGCS